jgi:hypothetical protein
MDAYQAALGLNAFNEQALQALESLSFSEPSPRLGEASSGSSGRHSLDSAAALEESNLEQEGRVGVSVQRGDVTPSH